jgi:hypothetical protein
MPYKLVAAPKGGQFRLSLVPLTEVQYDWLTA